MNKLRLFIAEHAFNPLFNRLFPKRERTRRRKGIFCTAVKQSGGIFPAPAKRKLFNRLFVACKLYIAVKQHIRRPHERIKPVNAQYQKRERLPHGIEPPDMRLLVHKNIVERLAVNIRRHVNFRAKQPEHKR